MTVVATGLGHSTKTPVASAPVQAEIKVVQNAPEDASPSYKEYDTPAAIRNSKAGSAVTVNGDYDEEMLDIPAFLRRQAD